MSTSKENDCSPQRVHTLAGTSWETNTLRQASLGCMLREAYRAPPCQIGYQCGCRRERLHLCVYSGRRIDHSSHSRENRPRGMHRLRAIGGFTYPFERGMPCGSPETNAYHLRIDFVPPCRLLDGDFVGKMVIKDSARLPGCISTPDHTEARRRRSAVHRRGGRSGRDHQGKP